jgi:hypothetical protein
LIDHAHEAREIFWLPKPATILLPQFLKPLRGTWSAKGAIIGRRIVVPHCRVEGKFAALVGSLLNDRGPASAHCSEAVIETSKLARDVKISKE